MKVRSFTFLLSLVLNAYSVNSQSINWVQDIAPIIYENCSSCHHQDGIAPFNLMSYADVALVSHSVMHVVEDRSMPPWPADPEYMHFANESYLSQDEIDKIVWWVNNGHPSGDMNLAPDPPEFIETGSLLDTIDFTVEITPYTLQSNSDEYRWFVIESPFDEDIYISKLEVFPGLENVVHHADLFYDNTGTSLYYDNLDPLSGFNGSTGSPVNSFYINAWQPGAFPAEYPENWGIKVPANSDLVVEIHYGPGGEGQTDNTIMNLQFVKEPENVRPVYAQWMLYDSYPSLVDGPLFIPANEVVTFHQESNPLANDLSIISICPHMHYLGKSYKVWYEDPDGTEHPLIDLPQWDFHWQKYYTFQHVKKIPAGSVIKSEGVYDNTIFNHDQPYDPPQDCYKGSTTLDEMFLCYFIFANYQEGDENIVMDESILNGIDFDKLDENTFNLFPNPGTDEIYLSGFFPGTNNLTFVISNSAGERIYESTRNNHRDIWYEYFDISDFQQGLYFIEWQSSETTGKLKFIKE